MEFNQDYEPDDDEDLTRRHDYSRSCFRGRVDGTGRGSAPRSGVHPFGGPGGFGIAGDWGRRAHGLLTPAGSMLPPHLQPSRKTADSVEETRSLSPSLGACFESGVEGHDAAASPITPVAGSTAHSPAPGASAPSGYAPTAVGSAVFADTPEVPPSPTTTMAGSQAFSDTPPFGRATLHMSWSPRWLSVGSEEEVLEEQRDEDGACLGGSDIRRAEDSSDAADEALLPALDDGPPRLNSPRLPQQGEGSLMSGSSLVCTPFTIPLSPSKLLPSKHRQVVWLINLVPGRWKRLSCVVWWPLLKHLLWVRDRRLRLQ
ncbi:hypothetical protein VPH35_106042 [Triticum aestivum]